MFKDRYDAAAKLAQQLMSYKGDPNVVILAIPRGGLELGYVLSKELQVPLDIVLTKKIGFPGNPEYAIGALSLEDDFVDERLAMTPDIKEHVDKEIKRLRAMLLERDVQYHKKTKPIPLEGKTVIITDDGIATGRTLHATIQVVKKKQPANIIVAIPVAPPEAITNLKDMVDQVVCLETPTPFFSVGQFYDIFRQVEDEEAIRLLDEANQ